MCIDCFRYLGFTSCAQVDAITPAEYELLMNAHELRLVDEEFFAHRQAFINFMAQATDKNGKPVYKRFEKFYDYKKAVAKVKHKKPSDGRFTRLKEHLRKGT